MARLNEPSAPTETLESLKRKFMRQNRDIARANSTQSLRIRSLENETSRLLSENLGLREQILRLRREIEEGKTQRIINHTGVLKSQLEVKLQELGALISGLGNEPASSKEQSPRNGKVVRSSPNTSPDQKNWKNMCTLSEAVSSQEGRLPPILENKSYPRRTLERQEILNIVADAEIDTTDSPDIGPPPVSQFVDEDPVKIDLPRRGTADKNEDVTGLDPTLSKNLEQRRKRKESNGSTELKRTSNPESLPRTTEATGSLKTGAKRKLSVREDDENDSASVPPSPDDFKFTRVTTSEDKVKNRGTIQPGAGCKVIRELAVAKGSGRERQSNSAPITTGRKVLAPKSVNDSPRKTSRVGTSEEQNPNKPDAPKSKPAKDRGKEKQSESVQVLPNDKPTLKTVEIQQDLEPETPAAGLDLFSPPSTEPSTAPPESRDTPPPSDLDVDTEGPRPSRRARASVNYAQPNLRDKMRRPTKDLVDAVIRDGKQPRGAVVKTEGEESVTTIKAEPDMEDAWKNMPVASSATVENSPLRSKAPESDTLPSSITTHRKRRESLLNQGESNGLKSSSTSAITALLAENRRAKAAAKAKGVESDAGLASKISKLDIYEFRGSPTSDDTSAASASEEKVIARGARRHSTLPSQNTHTSDGEVSDIEVARKVDTSTSRRRQSTLGLRNISTNTASGKELESEKSLKRVASVSGTADSGNGTSRSDRISARRRSMML